MAPADRFEQLSQRVREFAAERDWEQFHSPKNLSMAMIVEAGELVEHFQWLTEQDSERLDADKLKDVEEELADVFIYLIRLCQRLEIDLITAGNKKVSKNIEKYPAELVRGDSRKYTQY